MEGDNNMADQAPDPPPPPARASGDDVGGQEPEAWYKRWWGITLIVLGGLVLIGVVAGDPVEVAENVGAEVAGEVAEDDAETIAVPDVVGMRVVDGRDLLREEGFNVRTRYIEPDGNDPQTVVRTRPAAGSEAEVGSDVVMTVARASGSDPGTQPEEEPEPEEESEPIDRAAIQKTAFGTAFDEHRLDVADEIEDNVIEIETVDQFIFDRGGDTVLLAASSGFRGEQYHHDGAWASARHLTVIYGNLEHYQPILQVRIEGVEYVCPGHVMVQLHNRELDRDGWEAACRP